MCSFEKLTGSDIQVFAWLLYHSEMLYCAISVLVSLFREYQKFKANTLIGYFISPIYKLEE